MDELPKRSNNLRFNFDLVMAEIARWPIGTFIVMVLVSAPGVFVDDPGLRLTPVIAALEVAGNTCAILGAKALLLLMAYPRIHKSRFPGSYSISMFIVFIPIFIFYASAFGALLASAKSPPSPPSAWAMSLFLFFGYVLCSLFFAAFMPFQHAMLIKSEPRWDRMVAWWKSLFRRRDSASGR